MTNLSALMTDPQIVEMLTAEARGAIEIMVTSRNPVVSVDVTGETAQNGCLIVMLLPREVAEVVMRQMDSAVKKVAA